MLAMRVYTNKVYRMLASKNLEQPLWQNPRRTFLKSLQLLRRDYSAVATVYSSTYPFPSNTPFRVPRTVKSDHSISESYRSLSTDENKTDESKKSIAFYFKKYGYFFPIYWVTAYAIAGVGVYWGVVASGIDPEITMQSIEEFAGFPVFSYYGIKPEYGRVGVAFVMNEALEVVRFPICVATTPVVKRLWDSATTNKN